MVKGILDVAYGMSGDKIDRMAEKALVSTFFQAEANLSGIKTAHRPGIVANMRRIAVRMAGLAGESVLAERRVRLATMSIAMEAICEVYER